MKIEWTSPAERDMRRLDPAVRGRVHRAVVRLAETGHGGVKRLRGPKAEYRLRVGDWRVRFTIDFAAGILQVDRVLPRGEAYR